MVLCWLFGVTPHKLFCLQRQDSDAVNCSHQSSSSSFFLDIYVQSCQSIVHFRGFRWFWLELESLFHHCSQVRNWLITFHYQYALPTGIAVSFFFISLKNLKLNFEIQTNWGLVEFAIFFSLLRHMFFSGLLRGQQLLWQTNFHELPLYVPNLFRFLKSRVRTINLQSKRAKEIKFE